MVSYLTTQKQISDSRVVELTMQRDRLARERAAADADRAQLTAQLEAAQEQLAAGIRSREHMEEVRRAEGCAGQPET